MAISPDAERGPSRRSRPPGLKLSRKKALRRERATSQPLNLLERAILGSLAGEQPAHAFAIVKALRHPDGEPMFVESSIYRAIARLVEKGFLERGEGVTAKGPRPTYTPTLKGLEAMSRWVRTPAGLPIQVANEAWLRISATRFSLVRDVLRGLSTLGDELDRRLDDLELESRLARNDGEWDTAAELEYHLEREVLEASRRWLTTATHILDTRVSSQE